MNATPSYEVKFFLNKEALNSDHELKKVNKNLFNVTEEYKMSVLYLDTKDTQILNSQGWNVRVRKKETKDKTEFTFKKRYAVENDNLEEALTRAAQEGFDAENTDFKCEVDWGFPAKKTLSFSYEKKNKFKKLKGTELPDKETCISYAKQFAPAEFDDYASENWGTSTLTNCKKFGPVSVTRYVGSFNSVYSIDELTFEVWKVLEEDGTGYDYITEVSFKGTDYADLKQKRDFLMGFLLSRGILETNSILKTQLILERYN